MDIVRFATVQGSQCSIFHHVWWYLKEVGHGSTIHQAFFRENIYGMSHVSNPNHMNKNVWHTPNPSSNNSFYLAGDQLDVFYNKSRHLSVGLKAFFLDLRRLLFVFWSRTWVILRQKASTASANHTTWWPYS